MDGVSFMAGLLATGRFHGLGSGSTLDEATRAVGVESIDDIDEEYATLRRDYGFVELFFTGGPGQWVMTGGAVQMHRLAADDEDMAEEWRRGTGVSFPEYCTWEELRRELEKIPGIPEVELHRQSGYLEYRIPGTRNSALVVDGDEERDDWPGRGDVWSVSFG